MTYTPGNGADAEEQRLRANRWLRDLLETFRAAWNAQQKSSVYSLDNLEDFSPPCQVYLFWFTAPGGVHYSKLVRIALANRPDGETEVFGPIDAADASGTLVEVIQQDRWSGTFESPNVESPIFWAGDQRNASVAIELARLLFNAQRTLDEYIVDHARGRGRVAQNGAHTRTKQGFPSGFVWDIYGDPLSLSPTELVPPVRKIRRSSTDLGSAPQSEPEPIAAQSVFIYPHICVGGPPSRLRKKSSQGPGCLG